ncbi:MAG: glycoside hydrolase 43 family protein [Clostridium sp.]|nr:glycoside hydrolase 43 family protein [Clostridium sp.]
MKKILTLLCMLCALGCPAQERKAGRTQVPWCPDRGDGTYVNPVLHADYSDPDVCAVGEDYYLTASSFQCAPGLPVLHSRDLVNWRILGHALPALEPTGYFSEVRHGKGVWAPAIRHYDGRFHIYWGDPDQGIFRVTATDAAGPWSAPRLVKAGRGMIDPCPLWDEDGRCYLVYAWAASRAHINSVLCMQEMTSEGDTVKGAPVMVYDGNADDNFTAEGPKLYRRNGYYYIFCPAGGVEQGWQLAMRSRSPFGPYEARRVMDSGNTSVNGPHQGGWVHTALGEDWFMHFQDKGCYGRVVHLQPMHWEDDWPVIGEDPDGDGCGQPVMRCRKPRTSAPVAVEAPAVSDEFDTSRLGLQWQWHSNYNDLYGFTSPYGYLRLYSHKLSAGQVNLWEVPNMLLQKFPAETFEATTRVTMVSKEQHQRGGLIVMGWDYCALMVERDGDDFCLKQTVCTDAEQGGAEDPRIVARLKATARQTIPYSPTVSCTVYLRVRVESGGECTFAYSTDGRRFISLDRRFRARQGKWIGAKVGFVCVEPYVEPALNRGWLDVDWFRVSGL